jgi:hypothetical protein
MNTLFDRLPNLRLDPAAEDVHIPAPRPAFRLPSPSCLILRDRMPQNTTEKPLRRAHETINRSPHGLRAFTGSAGDHES